MKQDANTDVDELTAAEAARLVALYNTVAAQVAAARTQLRSPTKAEAAQAYRKLRNPLLAQTTPANGIDVADRAVLTILHRDRAAIIAGAEAAVRLELALLEANLRLEYEKGRQASVELDEVSKLPTEHQYFFGELRKRLVTGSMLDALTQEEFDVLGQLIVQKNDCPTHPNLKGLWNFTYRCGVVDHKVVGLTDDEKAAVLIASCPDAAAGMAAQAFFNEAAGRQLDLPMPLALALLTDMRAEHRSRGLRRTAEQIETVELNRTAKIIRTALGLDDNQVHELSEAWGDLFGRHFTNMERREAEADAQRLEEIRSFIPAAQALGMRDEQAAAAHWAQRKVIADDDDAGTSGNTVFTDGSELKRDGGDNDSSFREPLPDDEQKCADMTEDRAAFAASRAFSDQYAS